MKNDAADDSLRTVTTKLCVIGCGPAAISAMDDAKDLEPILLEGYGQWTKRDDIEYLPRFPNGIMSRYLMGCCQTRKKKNSESVIRVDFSNGPPFKIYTDSNKCVVAESVIVATGSMAIRPTFKGSDEGIGGFWNRGISACATCHGGAPIFWDRPVAVIGDGEYALEDALFLAKKASRVYMLNRRDAFSGHPPLVEKVVANPKIEVMWNTVVEEAYGSNVNGLLGGLRVNGALTGEYWPLGGLKLMNVVTGQVSDLKVYGLFLATGYEGATQFLDGQLELDSKGYIMNNGPRTSVPGIFASEDVENPRYWEAYGGAVCSGLAAVWFARHYLRKIDW